MYKAERWFVIQVEQTVVKHSRGNAIIGDPRRVSLITPNDSVLLLDKLSICVTRWWYTILSTINNSVWYNIMRTKTVKVGDVMSFHNCMKLGSLSFSMVAHRSVAFHVAARRGINHPTRLVTVMASPCVQWGSLLWWVCLTITKRKS